MLKRGQELYLLARNTKEERIAERRDLRQSGLKKEKLMHTGTS